MGEKLSYKNPQIFTLWAVFKKASPAQCTETEEIVGSAAKFEALAEKARTEEDVHLRGIYDCSALRADADIMIWLHGPQAESIQTVFRRLKGSEALKGLRHTFSVMGVHREAEFSKDHSPSFYRGLPPERWLTVYPFVRSYDWYVLPEEERRAMLREHGMLGREFPQVLANTVASFALGDYEWLLGLEAAEVTDLVDMMRRLRYSKARLHVREEVPFYTGRRIDSERMVEIVSQRVAS